MKKKKKKRKKRKEKVSGKNVNRRVNRWRGGKMARHTGDVPRLAWRGDLPLTLLMGSGLSEVKGGGTEDFGSSKLWMTTCSRRGYQ